MGFKIKNDTLIYYIAEHGETSITIPSSVKRIASYALSNQQNIISMELPDTIEIIEDNAFRNCSRLETVVFKGEPTKLGLLLFLGCNKLTRIESRDGIAQSILGDFLTRMRLGQISFEEANCLYKFSERNGKISINEFSNVALMNGENPRHYVYEIIGDEDFLMIPSTISGLSVEKIPYGMLPENSVLYCGGYIYSKSPRSSKARTAVAWLDGDLLIRKSSEHEILSFIKKHPGDVAFYLKGCDITTYNRFFEVISPNPELIESMMAVAKEYPEIVSMLLEIGQGISSNLVKEFSLDTRKKTVTELKKLWTTQLLTIGDTGEKVYKITNYKGLEEHIVIPAFIGKYRVGYVDMTFKDHVKSVTIENPDTELSHKTEMQIIKLSKNSNYNI